MANFKIKDIRTCTEGEKLTQLAEFKGQLIDIFEDFLDERGIVIPNSERDEDEDLDPEEAANIYGSDYDELADKLMDTLERWGLLKPEIAVDTPAGHLVAYAGTDAANPSVGIMLRPKDIEGQEIDLAFAETKCKELLDTDEAEDTVSLYVFGDPFDEDYTKKYSFYRNDVKKTLSDS